MTVKISIAWQNLPHPEEPAVDVVDRAQLVNQPDALVPVGTAPDGLPLLMRVGRSASIIEPVLRALYTGDVKHLTPDVRKLLLALNARVQTERRELGVLPRGPWSDGPHYVSMASVPQLWGPTLLARLLGTTSPLLLPEDVTSVRNDEVACRTSVGVLMSVDERRRIEHDLNTNQHLMLPLGDGAPGIVRVRDGSGIDVDEARPVVFEDLRRVPSAMFHTLRRVDGSTVDTASRGALADNDAYQQNLRRAHLVGWSVDRNDILGLIAEVARSLEPLHNDGLVHGDIKPANVLLTSLGAVAHDGLQLIAGDLSAAGTKGWNAPEQIIARPVSPATDVFALAQLVVLVLEAAIFGDETSFVVPVGGGRRTRERLMADPDVYLDPNLIDFTDDAVAAWRAFLRRCLSLDPARRIQTASAFADELMTIAERFPVPGERSVRGLIGQLTRRATVDSGRRMLTSAGGCAWILHDSYSHLHRTPWHLVASMIAA